jgi:catechol 2,3-dioxygenase-like lactoylglutathione lyase family enzyme
VELRKIGWVGTRTENPEATADFFGGVLGLRFRNSDDGVWVFQLPGGSKVEVLDHRRTSTSSRAL